MLDALVFNLPIILCAIIGIGLLVLELFIPGFGIAGFSGVILLVISVWMTFARHGTLPALILFVLLAIIVAVMLSTVIKSIKNGKLDNSFFVLNEQSVSEETAQLPVNELVGKKGVALSILRPAGLAEIDGVRYNVITEGEFIRKNASIVIQKVEGNKIVVSAENTNS
jgi:membrane-bound ClpP family serine protease